MNTIKILSLLLIGSMIISSIVLYQKNETSYQSNKKSATIDKNGDSNTIQINGQNLIFQKENSVNSISLTTFKFLDAINSKPLSNALVSINNGTYSNSGFTNSLGEVILIIYTTGFYIINVTESGYYFTSYNTSIDISVPLYTTYITPINAVGITSIDKVLEGNNYYLTYWYSTNGTIYNFTVFLNSVAITTTTDLFLNLNPLTPGIYNITVLMNCSNGLFSDQKNLYVIGIEFTEPINGSIINGGSVYVQFDYKQNYDPEPLHFNYLEAGVNNTQYIQTTNYKQNALILPLFDNSTYDLQFTFDFGSLGQLSYNLIIIAVNVIPALNVKVGDYWNYSAQTINPTNFTGTLQIIYLEVNSKISPFLVNMTVQNAYYDFISNNYLKTEIGWLIVSTINGYIEEISTSLTLPIQSLFFIFTGMQNKYSNYSVFNSFDQVLVKNSESSYNGIKTWLMTPTGGWAQSFFTINLQIMQQNGIMVFESFYAFSLLLQQITLTDSNYLPLAPKIMYNDITTIAGSANHISWNIKGSYTGSYTIYQNTSIKQIGSWSSGTDIIYDLSSLPVGVYNITAVFNNTFGQYAKFVTIVYVLSGPPPSTQTVTSTVQVTQTSTSLVSSTTTSTKTSTTTTTTTSTSTSILTTISTIITQIVDTTTKTTTGFTIVLLSLSLVGAFLLRRKRMKTE